MNQTLATVIAILFAQYTFADCQELYAKKIIEISNRMNPARTTVIVNAGAEVAVVTTLAAAGILSVGAVVALPATALAAGSYLGILAIKRSSYTKALLAIKQAEENEGPIFDKLVNRVLRKNEFASRDEIRETLLKLNSENAFCSISQTSTNVRLTKFKSMIKMIASKI